MALTYLTGIDDRLAHYSIAFSLSCAVVAHYPQVWEQRTTLMLRQRDEKLRENDEM